MRRILVLLLSLCLSVVASAQGNRIVCDETCRIEYQNTEVPKAAVKVKPAPAKPSSVPAYAVVSPVGRTNVGMIIQAPRLKTLEGKTIAVVGVSFMTGVTHPEIKRLILENYPSAKVLLLDEIGYSGPYPVPGVTRKQNEEFKRKLQDMKVDAVISGNGGCDPHNRRQCPQQGADDAWWGICFCQGRTARRLGQTDRRLSQIALSSSGIESTTPSNSLYISSGSIISGI